METRDKDGFTPLIRAAADGDPQTVNFLLQTGATVDARDNLGRTALTHAVRRSHHVIVDLLLDAGADVNLADESGSTPLDHAALTGDAEILAALRGEVVEERESAPAWRKRLTREQARRRRIRVTKWVAAIVVVFAAVIVTTTILRLRASAAMIIAVSNDDIATLARMFTGGVSPDLADAHGDTPLIVAAEGGHAAAASLLLRQRADPNHVDSEGMTALLRAGLTHPEIVESLLQFGADANAKDPHGRTLLNYAAASEGSARVVHALLKYRANPNVMGDNGPPLVAAIETGGADMIETVTDLLDHRADPNATDSAGTPPLVWAADRSYVEVARLLLDHGANPDATDRLHRTALDLAARSEQPELVRLLLDRRANPNITDSDGASPVMYSIAGLTDTDRRAQCAQIVRDLAAHAARLGTRDRLGRTALQLAIEKQQPEIASVLRQIGAPN